MKLLRTDLPDVVIVEPAAHGDARGWFMESWNEAAFNSALAALGLPAAPHFVQDNHSFSHAGVLRGLHYQLPPQEQGKLVRVVRGAVWDVAVDIRPDSPTFGRWTGAQLTEHNRRQQWIPPGFAHGFVTLENDTHFLYKTTAPYARELERSIRWNDPALGVAWPLLAGSAPPKVSPRDAVAPLLDQAECPPGLAARRAGQVPDGR